MKHRQYFARLALTGAFLLGTAVVHAQEAGMLGDLTRQAAGEARRGSSSNEDLTRNGDARSIAAGGTLTLLDAQGPGEVTHFWNTIGSKDFFHGRSIVLRIYYDGADSRASNRPSATSSAWDTGPTRTSPRCP